eukprot:5273921-Amphidinium_carterae.1
MRTLAARLASPSSMRSRRRSSTSDCDFADVNAGAIYEGMRLTASVIGVGKAAKQFANQSPVIASAIQMRSMRLQLHGCLRHVAVHHSCGWKTCCSC